MKQILLTILLLLSLNSSIFGQRIVQTDIFRVSYSVEKEQPLWVEYTVLCPNGDASRSGMDFWEPDGIHTSDDEDYENNVWDKGHLAPAAAFNCNKEMLRKTFNYLNSALQHQSLNRGIWNRLEAFERDLANFYTVEVRVDVIFDENSQRLATGAVVPSFFKKTMKWDDKTAEFLFPNIDTSGTDWIDYLQK
jgi:endonuclease G